MADRLDKLLSIARATWAGMSADEREAMLKAQRESWVCGEIAMGSDKDEARERRATRTRLESDAIASVALDAGDTQVEPSNKALTFGEVTAANLARCNRWHPGGIDDWSVADWAVAMAGEAGEVCNAVKKLRRVADGIVNISDEGRRIETRDAAIGKIGEELADTFLYLNLLACRLGIDLPSEIVRKFNATSERYGFPERLQAAQPKPDYKAAVRDLASAAKIAMGWMPKGSGGYYALQCKLEEHAAAIAAARSET